MAHWAKILADESVTKKTVLFDGRVAGNVVSFENSGEREVGYWMGASTGARASLRRRSRSSWAAWRCAVPFTRRSPGTTSAPSASYKSAASPSSARRTKNTSFGWERTRSRGHPDPAFR